MADSEGLREAVDLAIADVLAQQTPMLREQILHHVMDQLDTLPQTADDASAQLNAAAATIQDCGTQAEILAAMLDGVFRFCGRAALFVLRGGAAQGWQARGLMHNDAVKSIALDTTAGLSGRAIQTKAPAAGVASDFDAQFHKAFGTPVEPNAVLVPLLVREKVAALVYADSGTDAGGHLDAAAVELLLRFAGMWLELAGPRRAAAVAAEARSAASAALVSSSAPVATPAAPVPVPPIAAAAAAGQGEARGAEAATPVTGDAVPAEASTSSMESARELPVARTRPALSQQEEDVHRKAKRFAKLLVEEIKLYNQAKVADGRQKMDLYGLLRDDIEKSRASYEKRYGESAAASADYFTQELIRILAEGDVSLLGGSFSR